MDRVIAALVGLAIVAAFVVLVRWLNAKRLRSMSPEERRDNDADPARNVW